MHWHYLGVFLKLTAKFMLFIFLLTYNAAVYHRHSTINRQPHHIYGDEWHYLHLHGYHHNKRLPLYNSGPFFDQDSLNHTWHRCNWVIKSSGTSCRLQKLWDWYIQRVAAFLLRNKLGYLMTTVLSKQLSDTRFMKL